MAVAVPSPLHLMNLSFLEKRAIKTEIVVVCSVAEGLTISLSFHETRHELYFKQLLHDLHVKDMSQVGVMLN